MDEIDLSEMASYLETVNLGEAVFGSMATEDAFVRNHSSWLDELRRAIETKALYPASTLYLEPEERVTIYVVYAPTHSSQPKNRPVGNKLIKADAKLRFRLVPPTRLPSAGQDTLADLPIFELPVEAKLCSSSLILAQRHIQFGRLKRGDQRLVVGSGCVM